MLTIMGLLLFSGSSMCMSPRITQSFTYSAACPSHLLTLFWFTLKINGTSGLLQTYLQILIQKPLNILNNKHH